MDMLIKYSFIIVFILFLLIYHLLKHRNLSKRLKKLRANWGKLSGKKLDMESARLYFTFNKDNAFDHSYRVDENTWDDLDFNELFAIINRTVTPVGEQYLFNQLHHPVVKKSILDEREQLISHFTKNQDLREKVQLTIQQLNEKNAKYLPYSLWKPLPDKPFYTKFLPLFSLISVIVLLLVLGKVVHFTVLFVVFTINFVIRALVKRKIEIYLHSFQYLGVLITTAAKIASLKFTELHDIQAIFKEKLKYTRTIAKKLFTLQLKDELGFYEYLKIYFLWDVTGFYSVIGKIDKHITDLRTIYETIGLVDALQSIASFREQYPRFCRPVFHENNGNYHVVNIYNPLLDKPEPNSFTFDTRNVIVTGSNMAGKTTFLKTMGVNAILAQTIHTCMAEKYEAPFVNVLSSIGITNNLLEGKSYYLAEVESILRLLNASKSDSTHLFILDEIFQGTNSIERIAVSVEVLKYFANDKDYTIVATHDLQLCKMLNHDYGNYHFSESVCDEGLAFDYKIQPGPSTTRNAIALLDYVGYPKSIVENSYKRIR